MYCSLRNSTWEIHYSDFFVLLLTSICCNAHTHELNTFSYTCSSTICKSSRTAANIEEDHMERCDMCGNVCCFVTFFEEPVFSDHHLLPDFALCCLVVCAISRSLHSDTCAFDHSSLLLTLSYCTSESPLSASEALITRVLISLWMHRTRNPSLIFLRASFCLVVFFRCLRAPNSSNPSTRPSGQGPNGSVDSAANSRISGPLRPSKCGR